jgi:hypothetical protein
MEVLELIFLIKTVLKITEEIGCTKIFKEKQLFFSFP